MTARLDEALRPQPVSIPFVGTTDASGNFSITKSVRTAYWATVKVLAEVTGNPNWAVRTRDGIPLDYGVGPRLSAGSFVVAPTDQITIACSSAIPNATVKGHILGAQYTDQGSALAALSLTSNPLTINTATPPIVLGSIQTVGGGDTVSKNFPLPPGVQAVGWSVQFLGFGNPGGISITGHDTGQVYLSAGVVSGSPQDFEVAILSEADASIDCSVTSQAQPDRVFFLGFVQNPIVFLQARPGTPGTIIPVTFATQGSIDNNGQTKAAPWQAATSTPVRIGLPNIAAGVANRVQLVAAVAGKKIYLFAAHMTADVAVAANALHLCDGDPNAGGAIIDDFDTSVQAEKLMVYGGAPLSLGNGLFLYSDLAIGAQIHGGVSYSQG